MAKTPRSWIKSERDEAIDKANCFDAMIEAFKQAGDQFTHWNQCPSELVTRLTDERDQAEQTANDAMHDANVRREYAEKQEQRAEEAEDEAKAWMESDRKGTGLLIDAREERDKWRQRAEDAEKLVKVYAKWINKIADSGEWSSLNSVQGWAQNAQREADATREAAEAAKDKTGS